MVQFRQASLYSVLYTVKPVYKGQRTRRGNLKMWPL